MRDRTMDKIDYGIRVFLSIMGLLLVSWLIIELLTYRFQEMDAYTCQSVAINVAPGDDYWGYAEKYCDGNITHITDDLIDVYGLPLLVGKIVYLPMSDKCDISIVVEDGQEQVYENCN